MSIEAMKQALEVLEQINQLSVGKNAIALPGEIDGAMDNLRAAIEQPLKIDPAGCHIRVGEVSEPISVGYDQTSLELCEECGWKAIIPGDGCLVCARQKAKPVAYMYDFMSDNEVIRDWVTQSQEDIKREHGFNVRPLYTAPREWVGLTDEEIVELIKPAMSYYGYNPDHAVLTSGAGFVGLADAIEAKLKEKNAA